MLGGTKSKSSSVKFYSVYTRKSVRVPKKSVCVKSIRLKHGRGIRYQLVAKKGSQKLFKFCNKADANKFKKCKSIKSSKKSRKGRKSKKSRKGRKSKKSHKAHSHKHSRGSLRKYGRRKTKNHSHKHSHTKSRKSRKGSRHKHKH
jgi:hypothetical protein